MNPIVVDVPRNLAHLMGLKVNKIYVGGKTNGEVDNGYMED
jgi:hypothetical protein